MREIRISTDVFAAIWANRQENEETEDEILQRLLVSRKNPTRSEQIKGDSRSKIDGFFDRRNGVHFLQGFRIFRDYKGQTYSAIANSGKWLREDNGREFNSLNQLNGSITEGPENVWNGNWRFSENGSTQSIDVLRKQQRPEQS